MHKEDTHNRNAGVGVSPKNRQTKQIQSSAQHLAVEFVAEKPVNLDILHKVSCTEFLHDVNILCCGTVVW